MSKLIIIRGLPGSGKSTYAKKHFPGFTHFEADMYFERSGTYAFNSRELGAAHHWCLKSAEMALLWGNDVVVSNTFTQFLEMEAYLFAMVKLKVNFGVDVDVQIIELTTQFNSIHDIPVEKFEQMKSRWQDKATIIEYTGITEEQYTFGEQS